MDAHTYKELEYEEREKLIYEQIKQENASLKQELSSISYRMDEVIRDRDMKIRMLEESKGVELKRQREQLDTVIQELGEEKKELRRQIEIKDSELESLREIEANIAPSIEELKDEISKTKDELTTRMDEFEEFISKLLSTKFDEMQAEMLTEIDKITSEKMKGIQTDVAKIYESVANLSEPITDIDLQNIKIEIENSISQKLDEKIQYLDEGMNGMIEILKEHINSMPKPTTESLKEQKPEMKEEMRPVEDKIDDMETDLEPELVIEKPNDMQSTETEEQDKSQPQIKLSGNALKIWNALDIPKTLAEIVDTGISQSTAYRTLKSMVSQNQIKVIGGRPEKYQRI